MCVRCLLCPSVCPLSKEAPGRKAAERKHTRLCVVLIAISRGTNTFLTSALLPAPPSLLQSLSFSRFIHFSAYIMVGRIRNGVGGLRCCFVGWLIARKPNCMYHHPLRPAMVLCKGETLRQEGGGSRSHAVEMMVSFFALLLRAGGVGWFALFLPPKRDILPADRSGSFLR